MHRQDQNAGAGFAFQDHLGRRQPGHTRHVQIKKHHIGRLLISHLNRVAPVGSGRNDINVVIGFKNGLNPFGHQGVIIHD